MQSLPDHPESRLHLVLRLVLLALALAVVIIPCAIAASPATEPARLWQEVGMALGTAWSVGLGTLLRRRNTGGMVSGFIAGTGVGLVTAYVAGSTGGRGIGVLLPPAIGVGLGLLDGIGAKRFTGFERSVPAGLAVGAAVGAGTMISQFANLAGGLAIGYCLAVAIGMRPNERGGPIQRPGHRHIIALVIISILFAMAATQEVGEQQPERSPFGAIGAGLGVTVMVLFVMPMMTFVIGTVIARWLAPSVQTLRELSAYLRVMIVPMGAFALGAIAIVVIFAGFYGTLHKFEPAAFSGVPDRAGAVDWVLFSVFNAVAADYNAILPTSVGARMIVFVQLVLGIGWAVVVFAAVMAHVQPALESLARRGPPDDAS